MSETKPIDWSKIAGRAITDAEAERLCLYARDEVRIAAWPLFCRLRDEIARREKAEQSIRRFAHDFFGFSTSGDIDAVLVGCAKYVRPRWKERDEFRERAEKAEADLATLRDVLQGRSGDTIERKVRYLLQEVEDERAGVRHHRKRAQQAERERDRLRKEAGASTNPLGEIVGAVRYDGDRGTGPAEITMQFGGDDGPKVEYVRAGTSQLVADLSRERDHLRAIERGVAAAVSAPHGYRDEQLPSLVTQAIGDLSRERDELSTAFDAACAELRGEFPPHKALAVCIRELHEEREKYRKAATVLCGAHIGVPMPACPVCDRDTQREKVAHLAKQLRQAERNFEIAQENSKQAHRELRMWRKRGETADRIDALEARVTALETNPPLTPVAASKLAEDVLRREHEADAALRQALHAEGEPCILRSHEKWVRDLARGWRGRPEILDTWAREMARGRPEGLRTKWSELNRGGLSANTKRVIGGEEGDAC